MNYDATVKHLQAQNEQDIVASLIKNTAIRKKVSEYIDLSTDEAMHLIEMVLRADHAGVFELATKLAYEAIHKVAYQDAVDSADALESAEGQAAVQEMDRHFAKHGVYA